MPVTFLQWKWTQGNFRFTIMNHYLLYLLISTRWECISAQNNAPGQPTIRPFEDGVSRPPALVPSLRPSRQASRTPTFTSASPQPSTFSTSVSSLDPTLILFDIDLSIQPTNPPTDPLTNSPSHPPSLLPSINPTIFPTKSFSPSFRPSLSPSITTQPSLHPSGTPTISQRPSAIPSQQPSESSAPSEAPSASVQPSLSMYPSFLLSLAPSESPSLSVPPSHFPSVSSAPSLSGFPSHLPSHLPSDLPSDVPSVSNRPSIVPSRYPTRVPSVPPSNVPSLVPSNAPSYVPMIENRTVGMYITGIVDITAFAPNSDKSRAFQTLVDQQTIRYWKNWDRGGSVVYNSTTRFIRFGRPPRNWEFVNVATNTFQTLSPGGRAAGITMPRQAGIDGNNASANMVANMTFDLSLNATMPDSNSPFFAGNSSVDGNSTAWNETYDSFNQTPTLSPTVSLVPTMAPTASSQPSATVSPSASPSISGAPSSAPSPVPLAVTFVFWYEQEITWGERFNMNDTRWNTVEEILQFPFLYDQNWFTEQLINLTDNQLPVYINFVEVRDGSVAPSVMPSDMPSTVPSEAPSTAPTMMATEPPISGVTTQILIVAVVVPVLVVLSIAFAGIIYVTRVDHSSLRHADSFEEVIPLPDQDPGTPPGESPPPPPPQDGGEGGGEQASTVLLVTRSASPVLDPAEIFHPLQTQQSSSQPPSRTPSQAPSHAHSQSDAQSLSDHPAIVLAPPARTLSHGSFVSEITDAGGIRRQVFQGTPGYMSGTGTFTPSLTPLPIGMHSRDPSLESEGASSAAISTIARAHTTVAIPGSSGSSERMSPGGGRMSPFSTMRASIPTIPTSQMATNTDVADMGEGEVQAHYAVSESESDDDDHPSMAAFNLQIQDLDDL